MVKGAFKKSPKSKSRKSSRSSVSKILSKRRADDAALEAEFKKMLRRFAIQAGIATAITLGTIGATKLYQRRADAKQKLWEAYSRDPLNNPFPGL